ncbi:MAG TPA: hypothetical protein VL614_03210 [Acetobacteraceae bacterium]|jgi:hypothetical protein|nr:hypothetical protein [Acetobacteraceae bacterium]
MTEVVVAIYKTALAAETAIADLEAARVPTAKIRQFVRRRSADEDILEIRGRSAASGDRLVRVAVEERHTSLVQSILDMQAPAAMTQAPLTPASTPNP